MDRTALAICAGILCPLGAVLNIGCDAQHASPGATAPAIEAPLLLQLPVSDAPAWNSKSSVVPASGMAEESASADPVEAVADAEPTELKFADPNPGAKRVSPKSVSPDDDDDLANRWQDESSPAEPERVPENDVAANPLESIPERSELPWAHVGPRTPEMVAVAARADQRVQHGFQLAGRGALYSARAEFVAALQLIAQANDVQQNTRIYTNALSAGMVALRESADFLRQNTTRPQIDLERIVAGHKTPILKSTPAAKLTALAAVQSYYTYAREQFAATALQEPSGSMALYGLGKIAMASAGVNKSQQLEHTAQAMSLYQAALMAEPNNYRAANELGVLLADNGSLQQARELLIRSISLSSQPATWQNLAVVHYRLGEQQLAEQARQKAMAMRQNGNPAGPAVEWVDTATFARSATPSSGLVPAAAVEPIPGKTESDSAKPTATTAKKGISDWLPKNPWR